MKFLLSTLAALALAAPHPHCEAAPAAKRAQTRTQLSPEAARKIQGQTILASVRRHEAFLASDSLRGRDSATPDELAAARYIAAELKRYGVQPAGQNGGFLQRAPIASMAAPGQLPASMRGLVTTNVVGMLRGSDPQARGEVILLSAHLDHLGLGRAVNGDGIYNGADDDASGVAAVLELARVLSAGPRPKRTVVFALFGSEEIGGFGATYFREHPPLPLASFVANLEFEMIGRHDAAVAPHTLWLTGYEKSNLGAALAAHGARLVADPHPEQNFFQRSDNYTLAQRGMVAHTVSSFGLHPDYHRPSDDVAHLDFAHLTDSIQSFIAPVRWLCNSGFKPAWNPGERP